MKVNIAILCVASLMISSRAEDMTQRAKKMLEDMQSAVKEFSSKIPTYVNDDSAPSFLQLGYSTNCTVDTTKNPNDDPCVLAKRSKCKAEAAQNGGDGKDCDRITSFIQEGSVVDGTQKLLQQLASFQTLLKQDEESNAANIIKFKQEKEEKDTLIKQLDEKIKHAADDFKPPIAGESFLQVSRRHRRSNADNVKLAESARDGIALPGMTDDEFTQSEDIINKRFRMEENEEKSAEKNLQTLVHDLRKKYGFHHNRRHASSLSQGHRHHHRRQRHVLHPRLHPKPRAMTMTEIDDA